MNYESLSTMAIDATKIAFVVGLLIYLIRKVLPEEASYWLAERAYIVNIFVILSSVGLSFLGNWLNFLTFQPREVVELIYFGLFSAGVNSLAYEFLKNSRDEIIAREYREAEIEDELMTNQG